MKLKKKRSFKDIINSDTLTLVDFTASWCGPCRAMAPVLQELAKTRKEKVKIIKIDVDQNRAISDKLKIRGVPTFIMYKKGNQLWRQSGMQSRKQLESLVDQYA